MTNLHHIKKIPNGGFIFSATRKNETVILDEKFEIKKIIKGDFDWVQDSEVIKDNFILADNNHSRLVIVSKEYKEIGEITWKEDIRRVSNMIRVSGSEAKDIFI